MPRSRKTLSADCPGTAELQRSLNALWPAAKGSLNYVRKPCVRPNCEACARGDKHPVWLYTFTVDGRRRCVYVPAEHVEALRQALANGQELERLLYQCGELVAHQGPPADTGRT